MLLSRWGDDAAAPPSGRRPGLVVVLGVQPAGPAGREGVSGCG